MYPLLTPLLCEAVACSDVRATENLLLSCGDLAVSQYNLLVTINPMNSLGVLVLCLGIAAAHDKLSIVKFPLTPPEQCTSEHLHYNCCGSGESCHEISPGLWP